jgi:tetratricopeptide (TPR) repeat protein
MFFRNGRGRFARGMLSVVFSFLANLLTGVFTATWRPEFILFAVLLAVIWGSLEGYSKRLEEPGPRNEQDVASYLGKRHPSLARSRIPDPVRPFVNHETILRKARKFVRARHWRARVPIVNFWGGPGTGKTQAALELIRRYRRILWLLRIDFQHEFYFDLRPAALKPGLIGRLLVAALLYLGADEREIPSDDDAKAEWFYLLTKQKRVAIVIDGATSTEQVTKFLPGPGPSIVVVTSAAELTELEQRHNGRTIEVAPLLPGVARELLASAVTDGRIEAEHDAVTELIELCDRLPIALSVAGSILATLTTKSVSGLVSDIRDRYGIEIMASGKEKSVLAVFNNAYSLLGSLAQHCFRLFGTQPGSGEVSLSLLIAVTGEPAASVYEAVKDLVRFKLIDELGNDRYRVHGLRQRYVIYLNEQNPSEEDTRLLLDYYVRGSVTANEILAPDRPWRKLFFKRTVPDPRHDATKEPMAWLRAEWPNLLAAAKYGFANHPNLRAALLALTTWPLQESDKIINDAIAIDQFGIDVADKLGKRALESVMLSQRGWVHVFAGDFDTAYANFAEARRQAQNAGNREADATALEGMGVSRCRAGLRDEGLYFLRENYKLARAIGDRRRIAIAALFLAEFDDPEEGIRLAEEALAYFGSQSDADSYNRAKSLRRLGEQLTVLGTQCAVAADAETAWVRADDVLRQALAIMVNEHRLHDRAAITVSLGELARLRGREQEARQRFVEAAGLFAAGGYSKEADDARRRYDA